LLRTRSWCHLRPAERDALVRQPAGQPAPAPGPDHVQRPGIEGVGPASSGGWDWTTLLWQNCGTACDTANVGTATGALGVTTYPLVKNLNQLRVLNRLSNWKSETSPILGTMQQNSPWAVERLQTDIRSGTSELTTGGEMLARFGRGLQFAGPLIGAIVPPPLRGEPGAIAGRRRRREILRSKF
jgi:hypothetical protein